MSEYPWNQKNNTFTWLSSFYNPFKDSCSENFVIFIEKCPWEFTQKNVWRKLHYVESQFLSNKTLHQYDFLEIYKIFNMTNSTYLGC